MAYNQKHNIKPTSLQKSKEVILESTKVADGETSAQSAGSHIFEATLIKRSSVTIPC